MLGIIFTGGEGPNPEMLRQLINGITTEKLLAAADSGLTLAEAAGIKPDWITGDMDSLESAESLRFYPAERVIRHRQDKNRTDTELALNLLWEKGCDDVWIVGGGGGRLDHLFAIRDLFERGDNLQGRFPGRWLTACNDIHCIEEEAAKRVFFSINPENETLVSIFPVGTGPWEINSEGLKWPLDNVQWERGRYGLGLSNIAKEGYFSVTVKQGRFMIILPLPVLSALKEKDNVSHSN